MCRMLNGVAATFVLIYSGTKLAIFFSFRQEILDK